MKAGVRALGVAESFRGETSVIAGAVVTAARVVDGFSFATCTVGGMNATESLLTLYDALDRDDVQYLLISGIAPAWYNLLDLREIQDHVGRPVLSVSFEESEGLGDPLRETFEGEALEERLAIYEAQPQRHRVTVNEETVFVRSVGLQDEDRADVVRAFTPVGGRPEPIRVARMAARGVDTLRAREND